MGRLACLAAAAAVMLVLGLGDQASYFKSMPPWAIRHLWPRAQAATTPHAFQTWWAHRFNANAAAGRSKYRVWAISCRPDGEAVYRCTVLLHVLPHSYACAQLAIGTSGQIITGASITCPRSALRAAGIEPRSHTKQLAA